MTADPLPEVMTIPRPVTVASAVRMTCCPTTSPAVMVLLKLLPHGENGDEYPYSVTTTDAHCEATHAVPAGQAWHVGPHAFALLVASTHWPLQIVRPGLHVASQAPFGVQPFAAPEAIGHDAQEP
jgi:hypothetical protein